MESRSAAARLTRGRAVEAVVAGWAGVRRGAAALERLPAPAVVAAAALLQGLLTLAVALRVAAHDGWLFFPGDGTFAWQREWALAHGWAAAGPGGHGLPVFYAWMPLLFGDSLLRGLPAIVLLQTVVLAPLGLAAFHGIARRLAGPLYALLAVGIWVVLPLGLVPLWRSDLRPVYEDQALPHMLGLAASPAFPALVAVLGSGFFVLRAIDERRGSDALLAGLLLGLAVAIEPATVVLAAAGLAALAAARRLPELALYAAAAAPSLVTLALWRHTAPASLHGLGAGEDARALQALLPASFHDSLAFSWSHLHDNLLQFREFFWSNRLVEYLPVAGAFAVVRRSPAKGIYVAGWCAALAVVTAGSPAARVDTTTLFRQALPGLPAYALLAAAVVLLVPRWGRMRPLAPAAFARPRLSPALAAAAALLALLPLVLVPLLSAPPAHRVVWDPATASAPAVSAALAPRAAQSGLAWKRPAGSGGAAGYVVLGARTSDGCAPRVRDVCVLAARPLARTTAERAELTPAAARSSLRVAQAASWDGSGRVLVLVSPAAAPPAASGP